MTLEESKEEIPTFEIFAKICCDNCTANDAYCPSYCDELEKASGIPFEIIQAKYAQYDGDLRKVVRYIKNTKRGGIDMADIELVIKIPEEIYEIVLGRETNVSQEVLINARQLVALALLDSTPLPKGHGRLGDLDELEQRISNYVEHDAKITDDYIVARQRFIVDGIRQTPTIIEADTESEDKA